MLKKIIVNSIIIVLLIAFLGYVINLFFIPLSYRSSAQLIEISKGMSTNDIGLLLKEKEIIKHIGAFKIVSYLKGNKLMAGEYELAPNMSIWTVVNILRVGKVKVHNVIVPEGFTVKQISRLLKEEGLANESRFLSLAANKDFIKKLGIDAENLEGFLFPSTYSLTKVIKEENIISMMVKKFNRVVSENKIKESAEQKNMKFYDLIKLASLVEEEAEIADERPLISAVFLNRIKKKMKLESCATVLYAYGDKIKRKKHLNDKDLKINSPYNTYLNAGLPPTPISNPGLASIEAVLNPADVKYLYFVSRNDGLHHFSVTLEDHLDAKEKFSIR